MQLKKRADAGDVTAQGIVNGLKPEVKEALAEQAKGENQNVYTEQESAQLQKPETGEGGNQNVNTEPQKLSSKKVKPVKVGKTRTKLK